MARNQRTLLMLRRALLVLLLSCVPNLMAQAPLATSGATDSGLLVSTQWLSEHLSDPKLVIIDVGMAGMGNMGGLPDYEKGHIPGARKVNEDQFTSTAPPEAELPPDDQLKADLEAIGISDDSHVVIYSSHWAPMAARLLFTLDYVGFKNVALLDGGIEAWLSEKRPVNREVPKVTHGSLTIHPHPEIVARMADVKQWVIGTDTQVVLLDARPMKRYEAGHLAGAVPMFWENNLVSRSNPVLKSPDELRKMYVAAGVTPGKKIVSYCEVGLQASYAYFIARYLGYDAAMYDGSYEEWSKQKQPTVRGDNAR